MKTIAAFIALASLAAIASGCAGTGPQTRQESVPIEPAAPDRRTGEMKVLNNLATLLAEAENVRCPAEIAFSNPRDGWVFFSATTGDDVAARISGAESREIALRIVQGKPDREAMIHLAPGDYALSLSSVAGAVIQRVTVKAVPELIFCKYQYDPHVREYGPYDWDFMNANVLDHVNTIVGSGGDAQKQQAAEWRERGGRWIVEYHAKPYFENWNTQQAFDYYTKSDGLTDNEYDGVILDEFGGDEEKLKTTIESMRMLHGDERFKGKCFYPYEFGAHNCAEFVKTVAETGQRFAWEIYLQEPPGEASARAKLGFEVKLPMKKLLRKHPGCANNLIVCLGYMTITESLNINPGVDYKVWMDMQFHALATDPSFKGLYGLMEYTCGYVDEETVRWAARLYRHYGIEGNTEMLSARLGYSYLPGHLRNADFADGLKNWALEAAEDGSIAAKSRKGYSWLQGRYPRTTQGDTFLWMKRSAAKPNVVRQELANLVPGKLYSAKMITGDYGELASGKSEKKSHGISLIPGDGEILADRSFTSIVANNYSHGLDRFDASNNFWFNYHLIIFRAKSEKATLTISDWTPDGKSGGPAGQEVICNFVEVQPYWDGDE
ncbi:MAG TPA: hypothetical protein PL033_04515 [Candidatus Brocadiia bacterium]|nr:hypothetical protein [Candidatus Brocadiia bacterium]